MKFRILVVLLILVTLLLCSCGEKHAHDFSGAFKTDDIYHWHECECGETSDHAQHEWNQGIVTLQPTVDSEGERTFTCSVCRAKKVERIDKLTPDHQHTYDQLNSDETHHWNECECGEEGERTAHIWDEGKITQNPTVDSEGVKTFTCTACGFERTESIDKINPDHTHAFTISESDEHSHWSACLCGEKENVSGHIWDGGVVTTPATETQAGIKTFTCTECGHKATQIIPAAQNDGMSFAQSTLYKMSDKLAKTPLTIEAEIYVSPSTSGRAGAVFGNYLGIRQDLLLEIHENGVPRLYYSDRGGSVRDYKFTDVDVRTGDWVHIALTFDYSSKKMSLYLNGTLAQTIACEADMAVDITRYEFVVGGDNRSDNSNYFKGKIRSVSAYSDVRTAEEIANSALHGTNLYADGLLVSYLLSENCVGNDITDLSGNGYNISKEWLDSHETTLDYAYSFAVVGDTQWLCQNAPAKMEGIYDWIIANKDEKKIAHVFGLGDITEEWDNEKSEAEWIKAHQYISKLNGVVPYSLIRGNHDESKYFFKYFANSAYMDQFDGFMNGDDINNSYKEFTVGETDYLFITLDFGAGDEMLAWADELILAHPSHRVIITTHGYQGFDGNHLTFDNAHGSGGINAGSDVDPDGLRSYNDGAQIWDKLIKKHPNIFLVMSGHTPCEDILVLQTEGAHGNTVTQMLIDPQWMDPQKGGVGMVCMLYFSEDGSQMEVEWISTDTGKYYKEQNQFLLDLTDTFDTPPHAFRDSYNENYHYKACDCGYTYNSQAHVFDGGVLNADGFMEYSCACGYKRIASATDDPVAKALQALLEKYYRNGTYYKESAIYADFNLLKTTFYHQGKLWMDSMGYGTSQNGKLTHFTVSANGIFGTEEEQNERGMEDYFLTLYDFVMGSYGDLRLDLGWNEHDGVYSSANQDAIEGARIFATLLAIERMDDYSLTRVTVEEQDNRLIIKLYAGETLFSEITIGAYATTTLVNHAEDTLGVLYTKAGANGICEITAPAVSGYVPQYDTMRLDTRYEALTRTVCYSQLDVWDGVSVSASLAGAGTADDPYLIQSGADLAYLKTLVDAATNYTDTPCYGQYFKMTKSIDLGGANFMIGSHSAWNNYDGFAGIFDGNHCSIRGLAIQPASGSAALFACVKKGAVVKNFSLYGSVKGTSTVGSAVAYLLGTAENITSYVTVEGTSTMGGVIANAENNSSVVSGCVNYGTVTGSSFIIGGIVGSGGNVITDCINHAVVTGADVTGGITGVTKTTGEIKNCYNYGAVNAKGKSGGIAGNIQKPIINCVNYGNVTGTWALGGIAGYVEAGKTTTIKNCVNYGNVNGSTTGNGGILGLSETTAGAVVVTGCTNHGSVTATWGGGGIVGDTRGDVSECINYGTVSGLGELGGIVGKTYGSVTDCANYGLISGKQDIIGGIVGHLFDTTHGKTIWTTNTQSGTVEGPNAREIIGKGYTYVEEEETPVEPGPLTEEEFKAQAAMFGSPWTNNETRMKIVVAIRMTKGTVITFLGDTSVYCWGVMETTDKVNATEGAWKDSGWNTTWDNPNQATYTTTYASGYLVLTVGKLNASGKVGATLTQEELDQIHSLFKVEGEKAANNESGAVNNPTLEDDMVSINHRGWHEAPENTLSAYRESHAHGFAYVECDVQFTKDGIPVLLHDDTIDRTSNGSGTLSQMTYAELLQYDFSYDDNDTVNDFSAYRGEKIPTFEEFIALCKTLELHPYIEIKGSLTAAEAQKLVQIVSDAGMLDNVSWLSFSGDALAKIADCDRTARLVWVLTDTNATKIAANNIPFAEANLMTGESEVVFDLYYTLVNQDVVNVLSEKNIPLEVWTVNDANTILHLHAYVTGVTSDIYNAKQVIADANENS